MMFAIDIGERSEPFDELSGLRRVYRSDAELHPTRTGARGFEPRLDRERFAERDPGAKAFP